MNNTLKPVLTTKSNPETASARVEELVARGAEIDVELELLLRAQIYQSLGNCASCFENLYQEITEAIQNNWNAGGPIPDRLRVLRAMYYQLEEIDQNKKELENGSEVKQVTH